jgi:hypothetical protein
MSVVCDPAVVSAPRNDVAPVLPAFTSGTVIATPRGEITVEDLRVGDHVLTRDNGLQEIRAIARKDVSLGEMSAQPQLCPVKIEKGALGNGLPERDMVVSPDHRMLIVNEDALLYFEEREVLVAAKDLVGRPGISWDVPQEAVFVAIAFEAHEVILSNGAWAESLEPTHPALRAPAASDAVYNHFPSLRPAVSAPARRALGAQEFALLG